MPVSANIVIFCCRVFVFACRFLPWVHQVVLLFSPARKFRSLLIAPPSHRSTTKNDNLSLPICASHLHCPSALPLHPLVISLSSSRHSLVVPSSSSHCSYLAFLVSVSLLYPESCGTQLSVNHCIPVNCAPFFGSDLQEMAQNNTFTYHGFEWCIGKLSHFYNVFVSIM